MFYGGMVQPKNYLHTGTHSALPPALATLTRFCPAVMQCFTICCLITCMWMIFGALGAARSVEQRKEAYRRAHLGTADS